MGKVSPGVFLNNYFMKYPKQNIILSPITFLRRFRIIHIIFCSLKKSYAMNLFPTRSVKCEKYSKLILLSRHLNCRNMNKVVLFLKYIITVVIVGGVGKQHILVPCQKYFLMRVRMSGSLKN